MADEFQIKAEMVIELDEKSLEAVTQQVQQRVEKGVEGGVRRGSAGAARETSSGAPKRRGGDDGRAPRTTTKGSGDSPRATARTQARERVRVERQARSRPSLTDADGGQPRQQRQVGVRRRPRRFRDRQGAPRARRARGGRVGARGGRMAGLARAGAVGLGVAGGVAIGVGAVVAAVGLVAGAAVGIYKYMSGRLDSLLQKANASPAAAVLAIKDEIRQRRRDFLFGQSVAPSAARFAEARNDLRDQLARLQAALQKGLFSILGPATEAITEALDTILDKLGVEDLAEKAADSNKVFRQLMSDVLSRAFDTGVYVQPQPAPVTGGFGGLTP